MTIASSPDLIERCLPIELLVLDVDGVLTDGAIIIDDLGVESKHFHVKDGGGIALWRKAGKKVAIISGRSALCVDHRAAELGISPVIQGAADKKIPILALLQDLGLEPRQVCAMGDDLADLRMLGVVGLAACPVDASVEVAESAHFVTEKPGGRGAVRELIEVILRHQGVWDGLIAGYRGRDEFDVILDRRAHT
jgi:3-deoxy-D-manno-octulosonate 8-phosphate phosphatase (KDO 8-P phosphatase)